jgi:hypothetical protein
MKIVDRKTFLTLPAGTAYSKSEEPYAFEAIRIKADTSFTEGAGDWFELCLNDIEASGSDQLYDRWEDMRNNGASYPLDLETIGRDGCFEAKAIFMIYERDDLVKLRDLFADLVEKATA